MARQHFRLKPSVETLGKGIEGTQWPSLFGKFNVLQQLAQLVDLGCLKNTIYTNHPVGNFMRKHFITDFSFTEETKGLKIIQLH